MTDPIQITNHEEEAGNRLLPDSQEIEEFVAMVKNSVKPFQIMENLLFGILNNMDVEAAIGNQLSFHGKLLDEDQEGREEEEYRIAILAKYETFMSSGTPEQLMQVFLSLTGADWINWKDQKELLVFVQRLTAYISSYEDRELLEKLLPVMRRLKQAGQGLELSIVEDNSFRLRTSTGVAETTTGLFRAGISSTVKMARIIR